MPDQAEGDAAILPIVEEVAVVRKRRSSRRVKVRTVTDAVRETLRASLDSLDVSVERVAIGCEVATVPQIRTEGDVTIVPVLEEVLVVEKRLILKEEVRIRQVKRTENIETPVTRRRQRAVVTRMDADKPQPKSENQP